MKKTEEISKQSSTTSKKGKEVTKLTLREFKQYITALMENYTPDLPVIVEVKHSRHTQTFDVIPRHMRVHPKDIVYEVQNITVEELDSTNEPGLYKAAETFQMEKKKITNFYGLFITPDKKRDLRYFSSDEKCEDWLKKKVKSLNVY